MSTITIYSHQNCKILIFHTFSQASLQTGQWQCEHRLKGFSYITPQHPRQTGISLGPRSVGPVTRGSSRIMISRGLMSREAIKYLPSSLHHFTSYGSFWLIFNLKIPITVTHNFIYSKYEFLRKQLEYKVITNTYTCISRNKLLQQITSSKELTLLLISWDATTS